VQNDGVLERPSSSEAAATLAAGGDMHVDDGQPPEGHSDDVAIDIAPEYSVEGVSSARRGGGNAATAQAPIDGGADRGGVTTAALASPFVAARGAGAGAGRGGGAAEAGPHADAAAGGAMRAGSGVSDSDPGSPHSDSGLRSDSEGEELPHADAPLQTYTGSLVLHPSSLRPLHNATCGLLLFRPQKGLRISLLLPRCFSSSVFQASVLCSMCTR